MSTTPRTDWPERLTISDYARACAEVGGRAVSRQSILARIESGKLTTEDVTIGGKTTRYLNTRTHPPGALPGRWPNRPPGSVPLPRKAKKPLAP